MPRNTPEKNKHTNRNKHVNPLPTYLNPECHVTVGREFFENPLPEDALLNSTAPNHMQAKTTEYNQLLRLANGNHEETFFHWARVGT